MSIGKLIRYRWLCIALVLCTTVRCSAADVTAALKEIIAGKASFKSVEEIQAFEDKLREVTDRVIKATVGIRVGGAAGSGVIIDEEGHILTAGHVSGAANRDAIIILHDGTQLKAKTLGANNGVDSGMMKITSKDVKDLVHAEMGDSKKLARGQWCIAIGHPGGYTAGRTAPVRLGRILGSSPTTVLTDCVLIGGDSGGPLFDFEGKVIGINSRIGGLLSQNVHVPVGTFKNTWDRLVKAEVWGNRPGGTRRRGGPQQPRVRNPRKGEPMIGVVEKLGAKGATIGKIEKDSPAEKAGLKAGDVIVKFGDTKIADFRALMLSVRKAKAGKAIKVSVKRGKEDVVVDLTVAAQK